MSEIMYPLKAVHIIEDRADGTRIVELERDNGDYIMAVDPKTRQCTTERKRFVMAADGKTLTP